MFIELVTMYVEYALEYFTSNTFIVSTINLAFETYTLSSYCNLNIKIIVRFHSGRLIAFNYSRNIYS